MGGPSDRKAFKRSRVRTPPAPLTRPGSSPRRPRPARPSATAMTHPPPAARPPPPRGPRRGQSGGGARPPRRPAARSVAGRARPPRAAVPPYASMPYVTQEGAGGPPQPGFFGGLLGRARDPLFVLRDPHAPNFAMPELGLDPDVNLARLDPPRPPLDRMAGARPG